MTIPGGEIPVCVLIESLITANYIPVQRGILLWSKVNFIYLSNILKEFTARFFNSLYSGIFSAAMWDEFHAVYLYGLELIPSKLSSQRTTKTKQIVVGKSVSNGRQDWTAYVNIKKLAQFECRKKYASKLFTVPLINKLTIIRV